MRQYDRLLDLLEAQQRNQDEIMRLLSRIVSMLEDGNEAWRKGFAAQRGWTYLPPEERP
jgi:hypothetical protein